MAVRDSAKRVRPSREVDPPAASAPAARNGPTPQLCSRISPPASKWWVRGVGQIFTTKALRHEEIQKDGYPQIWQILGIEIGDICGSPLHSLVSL
jgi:hypothetical protein